LLLLPFLSQCGRESTEDISQALLRKSQPIAQEFSKVLKDELQRAIQEKGPAGGIEVCKTVSTLWEDKFSTIDPDVLRVRRISLKTRNPERHTPTEAERTWLEQQEQALRDQKTAPAPTILRGESSTTVLFPIIINDALCLRCHGPQEMITDDVKQALGENYPLDRATGYQQGDLRGALAIEWKP
jgi:hypothetical protein